MKNKIMPIKMQNALDLYRSAKTYLSGPDGMNNEVTMWFIAGGLLMQEISSRINKTAFGGLHQKIGVERNKKIKTIRILDVACGPGNFANHLGFIIPQLKVVGIDTNIAFLKWARKKFTNLGWKFIEGDASKIELGKKSDFITASSAYHHIPDFEKLSFLKNLKSHLKNNGIILICDNFLPDYSTSFEKQKSIKEYYSLLTQYYKSGNATKNAIKVIKQARKLELSGKDEYKTSFRIFEAQVKAAGLEIVKDILVWGISQNGMGSHVIILKAPR